MSFRNSFAVVLLLAFAAATWYWSLPEPPAAIASGTRGSMPAGYYVRGARLLGTDEAGRPTYVVRAERVEEAGDQERLDMHRVEIEYRPENDVPWILTATRASAPKSGSYLDLHGTVELRSEQPDRDRRVIATTQLRFLPNEFRAESDAAVVLTIGENRKIEAVGLEAHLKEDRVELESNVHGQFLR